MVRKLVFLIAIDCMVILLFSPSVESLYEKQTKSPVGEHAERKSHANNKGYCEIKALHQEPGCSEYTYNINGDFTGCGGYTCSIPYPSRVGDTNRRVDGEGMMKIRKTHKMEWNTLAQEGLSYCIFPRHILESDSSLKNWELINKTMKELMDVNFDIGTHINPKDYSKMNTASPKPKVDVTKDKPQTICDKDDDSYINRAAQIDAQPDISCKNPYKIQVTEIKANGRRLQNWLHIKVYAEKIEKTNITLLCPTGAMKYLLLEVRDQGGLPVGEFSDEIPCDHPDSKDILECPEGVACRKIVGTRKNTMPCMMDPYRAITHPWIFMAGTAGTPPIGGGSASTSSTSAPGSPASAPAAPTEEPFTEVHINWKFAQHTSNIVSQLHFSALIIENTTKVNYFSGRRDKFSPEFRCDPYYPINEKFLYDCYEDRDLTCRFFTLGGCKSWASSKCETKTGTSRCRNWHVPPVQTEPKADWYGCSLGGSKNLRMYGFTAQYTPLFPTLKTLGAPDYFNRKFIKVSDINCHAPITDATFFTTGAEWKGVMPVRYNQLKDISKLKPRNDYWDPGYGGPGVTIEPKNTGEGMALSGGGRSSSAFSKIGNKLQSEKYPWFYTKYHDISDQTKGEYDQPATTYFGTKYTKEAYGPDYEKKSPEMVKELKTYKSLQQQAATERCPCPKLPTTLPPELATRPPNELDGRRYHSIQMLIAWVILIPISIFSSRYYKETFSKVFFLQEFWWYSVHVLSLFTALIFMLGGIYSLEIKKSEGSVWVEATWIHVILGSVTIVLFAIHLCVGCFRSFDVNVRILQIMLHWMIGWLEYLMASATILISSRIPQGFVSCEAIYVYYGFLTFQVLFYIGMEIHMRYVDGLLHLNPPRSYLPPPMMRLFHRNAPFSVFRMYMLGVYSTVCIVVYAAMHILMAVDETSCYQEVRKKEVEVNI